MGHMAFIVDRSGALSAPYLASAPVKASAPDDM